MEVPRVDDGDAAARGRRHRHRARRPSSPRAWTDDAFAYVAAYAAVSVAVELSIVAIWSVSVCIYLLLP